jgi:DNA invertase Pin-like site-specific DNA recombinase
MDKPPPVRPVRWASWIAVSSEAQAEKISLEQQAADNAAAVALHGGRLVASLSVPGHTRYYALFEDAARDIPAYRELHTLVERRAFDVLVFRDISRLGRTAALCMNVMEICRQAGIALYPTADPPRTIEVRSGTSDLLMGAFHSVNAQDEAHRLRERNRFGMIGRAKEGKIPSHPAFGYRIAWDEHGQRQMVIDEPAAAVVRTIYDLYLSGMGAPQIAARLRALDLPRASGRPWTTTGVFNVLDQAMRHAGYNELNRHSPDGRPYICVRGNWEPIISEQMLERLRQERAQRTKSHKLANTIHRFSGVCTCAECGGRMISKAQRLSMVCPRHIPNNIIRLADLLAAVDTAFADLDVAHTPAEDEDETAALHARLYAHDAELQRIHDATLRADDLHVDGDLDDERYRRQLKRLAAQRRAVEVERERTRRMIDAAAGRGTRRQRLEAVVTVGRTMLHHPDPTLSNAWLRGHVRVHITAGTVTEIEYL